MWTRAELKEKAKAALKRNYWKTVLVGILVATLGTAGGLSLNYNVQDEDVEEITQQIETLMVSSEDTAFANAAGMQYSEQYWYSDNSEEYWTGYYDGYFGVEKESDSLDYLDGYNDGVLDDYVEAGYDPYAVPEVNNSMDSARALGIIGGVLLVCFAILLLAFVIGLLAAAFVGNPLDLGARKFMLTNLNEKAQISELAYAFDSNYKNIVKVLFIRDIYLVLWTLLFIIPGLVKAYEYRMIPYLLTENPNLSKEEAFAISKQMMQGQKWRAFVLDLSFIGWDTLSVFTLGILNTFYITPYRNLTFAALFEELNAQNGYPARATYGTYEEI